MRYAGRITTSHQAPSEDASSPNGTSAIRDASQSIRIGHRGDIEVSASGAHAADGERNIAARLRAVHAVM
jgi:hypothetical protein